MGRLLRLEVELVGARGRDGRKLLLKGRHGEVVWCGVNARSRWETTRPSGCGSVRRSGGGVEWLRNRREGEVG